MKWMVLGLFFVGVLASAQNKGSQAEQKSCYEQGRQYVSDEKSTFAAGTIHLLQTHYDQPTRTCFVKFLVFTSKSLSPLVFTSAEYVVDGYERKSIAACVTDQNKTVVDSCFVRQQKVATQSEWDELVNRAIPAFQPVWSASR